MIQTSIKFQVLISIIIFIICVCFINDLAEKAEVWTSVWKQVIYEKKS